MTVKGRIQSALALTAVLAASNAAADDFTWFGQTADGNWLAGIKVESVDNGRSGYDSAANVGLLFGYEFSRPIGLDGTSSIEIDFTDSFDSGGISDDSIFGVGGEWDTQNIGVHFTYRTPGNVYFKAKLGAIRSEVTSKLDGIGDAKESDTSFSYGAGLGLKMGQTGNFNMELELVGTSGDNDLTMISLGGIYKFR
jgi:hypothetical protein